MCVDDVDVLVLIVQNGFSGRVHCEFSQWPKIDQNQEMPKRQTIQIHIKPEELCRNRRCTYHYWKYLQFAMYLPL